MSDYRTEHDLLGQCQVPTDALYGIHTQRALDNFPLTGRTIHPALIHAFGQVKLACAQTNVQLNTAVNPQFGQWDDPTYNAIERACHEMAEGLLDEHIIVDALQGGAGTSTNMNVNEVLANRALQLLNQPLGDYDTIHPLNDINLHQSTNDTYPTALKVAAITLLRELEIKIIALHDAFAQKEKEFASIVRVGRTQLQDAVLTTLGRQMGAYAEALGRDRWRIYKCEERLRVINLGGTAIGTGLGAPRQFIFQAVEHLRDITGMGLARAENMLEATQNTDPFIEVSGIIRTLASNLIKIANDLRLLSSGPDAGLGEITLPAKQAGSSIMPGKVNPVICEAVIQCAIVATSHDQTLMTACSSGQLELNHLMPVIADSLLNELSLMTNACDIFTRHCITGIEANQDRCRLHVAGSTATITALIDVIGYEKGTEVAERSKKENKTIKQVVLELKLMDEQQFDQRISPQAVMRLGS